MLPFGLVHLHTDLGLLGVRENNVREEVFLSQEEQSPNTEADFLILLKMPTSILTNTALDLHCANGLVIYIIPCTACIYSS